MAIIIWTGPHPLEDNRDYIEAVHINELRDAINGILDGSNLPDISHGDLSGVGATDHHDNSNDPTDNQKAALDASDSPSGTNEFITKSFADANYIGGGVASVNTLTGAVELEAGTGIDVSLVGGKVRITNVAASGVVESLNTLTGDIDIIAGSGISVANVSGDIQISATSSGGDLDTTLGLGDTADDKDFILNDGSSNAIFQVDVSAAIVQIGTSGQNADLELYGDLNLHSNITGVDTISAPSDMTLQDANANGGAAITLTQLFAPTATSHAQDTDVGTDSNVWTFDNDGDGGGTNVYGSSVKNDLQIWTSPIAGGDVTVMTLKDNGMFFDLIDTTNSGQAAFKLKYDPGSQSDNFFQIDLFTLGDTAYNVFKVDYQGKLEIGKTFTGALDPTTLTGNRTYTLPDLDGTLLLSTGTPNDSFTVDSDDSVPGPSGGGGAYYGGTGTGRNVYLLCNPADTFTGGAGVVGGLVGVNSGASGSGNIYMQFWGATAGQRAMLDLQYDSSTPSNNGLGVSVWDGSSSMRKVFDASYDGKISFGIVTGSHAVLDPTGVTAQRILTVPDAGGTIALDSTALMDSTYEMGTIAFTASSSENLDLSSKFSAISSVVATADGNVNVYHGTPSGGTVDIKTSAIFTGNVSYFVKGTPV